MKPQRLDMLLAFKAIALSSGLTSQEKRIGGTIIDHFNHKTGQCDPSLGGIAALLGINRRTVIRAVNRLVSLRLLERVRHGGNFHRNHYVPNWRKYGELEAKWKALRELHKKQKLSLCQCQNGDDGSDSAVSQTFPTNHSNLTSIMTTPKPNPPPPQKGRSSGLGKTGNGSRSTQVASAFHAKQSVSYGDMGRDAAESRWLRDLQRCFGHDWKISGPLADAISEDLKNKTTAFEMKYPGKGLDFVLQQLRSTHPKLG